MNVPSDETSRAEVAAQINESGFHLVYQPIVHLEAGTVIGVEALTRFDDGAPTEQRFLRCERMGLAPDLDMAIIDRALDDLASLPDGYVSINLSPSTLLDERVGQALLTTGVPAERLVIEVTEHARIPDYRRASELVAALRAAGTRLAVDDAGAGYATFRHILTLRPDIIKMDRSITQNIDADTARLALAAALVVFAREIGATVVAEGVERGAEIRALRRAGIDQAQGYALGAPAPLPLPTVDYDPAAVDNVVDFREEDNASDRAAALGRVRSAVECVQGAEDDLANTVALARSAGVTWEELADVLGMTRQGVSKRYGRRSA